MKTRVLAFLLALFAVLSTIGQKTAYAVTDAADDTKSVIGGIFSYNEMGEREEEWQRYADDSLLQNPVDNCWYAIALSQYDYYVRFDKYEHLLSEYLLKAENEGTFISATTRQKIALTQIACGADPYDSAFTKVADETIGKLGIMSYVFGLHLLNNGVISESYTRQALINDIIKLQKEDGGWAVTGNYSDVDATAMVITALAPCYLVCGFDSVTEAVDKAVVFLSEKQLEDGGFASYGKENPESMAQVITALSSLQIDFAKDERFIKNDAHILSAALKFRLENGAFCHSTDNMKPSQMATEQMLYALVAYEKFLNNDGRLFEFGERLTRAEQSEQTIQPEQNGQIEAGETDISGNETINNEASESKTANSEVTAKADKFSAEDTIEIYDTYAATTNTKAVTAIIIAVLTLLAWGRLFIRGKRNPKAYIFVVFIGIAALLITRFVNISSGDSYYNGKETVKSQVSGKVTMSIRCDTIMDQKDNSHIPSDGVILSESVFEIEEGNTVFDILTEACKKNGLQMDNKGSSTYGTVYISGIGYIYELQYGDLSGWMYRVNGVTPSVGAGEYVLKDGDVIEWLYTRDLGRDFDIYK